MEVGREDASFAEPLPLIYPFFLLLAPSTSILFLLPTAAQVRVRQSNKTKRPKKCVKDGSLEEIFINNQLLSPSM